MYANPFNQSITINGFGLGIAAAVPFKKIIKNNSVYFAMPDLTEYTIILSNGNATKCDVTVYIDNTIVGTWRINPSSNIGIERPANIPKKFVLVKEGTNTAYQAGIGTYDTNGLIKAVFRPEKYKRVSKPSNKQPSASTRQNYSMRPQTEARTNNLMMQSSNNLQPAGTGLGDYSNQKFSTGSGLTDIDYSNVTTINVRLVVDDSLNTSNITSVRNYSDYQYYYNNVPPKIYDENNNYYGFYSNPENYDRFYTEQ